MDKMTRPYSLNSRVGLNVNVPNSVSSLRLNSAAKSSRGNSSQASHSKIAAQATCWKRETEHRLSFIREPIPRLSSITGRYADIAFLSLLPSISHSDWWPRIRGRNSKLAWHASINHWPIVGQGKWPALTRQHAQAWGHTVNGLYAHVGQNWKASLATSSSKINMLCSQFASPVRLPVPHSASDTRPDHPQTEVQLNLHKRNEHWEAIPRIQPAILDHGYMPMASVADLSVSCVISIANQLLTDLKLPTASTSDVRQRTIPLYYFDKFKDSNSYN